MPDLLQPRHIPTLPNSARPDNSGQRIVILPPQYMVIARMGDATGTTIWSD